MNNLNFRKTIENVKSLVDIWLVIDNKKNDRDWVNNLTMWVIQR